MANFVWRPRFPQTFSSSPSLATDQLRTSAEICVGKLLASKSVVKSTPDLPSLRLAHSSGTLVPRGVTQPMPVTTTRRLMLLPIQIRNSPRRHGEEKIDCHCKFLS